MLWAPTPRLTPACAASLQTKDTLTLRASSFGSKCELPDPFLKKVANCGVVDLILSFASFKADKELKKGDGAKRQRLTGELLQELWLAGAVAGVGLVLPRAAPPAQTSHRVCLLNGAHRHPQAGGCQRRWRPQQRAVHPDPD